MFKKLLFIFFFFILTIYLNAYELPKIEINKDNRPEIVIFNATSILVKEKLSYKIEWKTINSTDVILTYIGKVKLSGSITITKGEYNRGPITLTASSRDSSFSDTETINMKKSDEPQVIFLKSKEPKVQSYHYNTMPYPTRRHRPYRRKYN